MTQLAALQDLDARIHAAFAATGLAFAGSYVPPGGDPDADSVPVRGYYDAAVQQVGEFGHVTGPRDVVRIMTADVPDPESGATITFDGLTLTLEAKTEADQSMQRWVVSRG